MKYIQSENFFSRSIRGEWVILKQGDSYCFKLNNSAGFLWQILKKPATKNKLTSALQKEYHLPVNQAEKDVLGFLDQGIKNGYITAKE